ncbi:MAG: hypothetical protein FJY85_21855, partial [Deltaproteobacteria bacterium]|nr:hypothetical protein [Deltaproteobacteria bacterium]
NPPFINAIESGIATPFKHFLSASTKRLRGTADLAYHFVDLADRVVGLSGAIGLVQPKTFLNADSALDLRKDIRLRRTPTLIYIPAEEGIFFPGASTYICLITLYHTECCAVSEATSPLVPAWHRGPVTESNWWYAAQRILERADRLPSKDSVLLGDHFEVVASMTAAEAYAIKPFILDDSDSPHLRLVTTGLIDPDEPLWGDTPCRCLGSTYSYPALAVNAEMPPSVGRRLKRARRPKVLVAGLCTRLEAFLDSRAEYVGAVSTFSVFHPSDNVSALGRLCAWLNSDEATSQTRAELGAASVGGGYMTLKKRALMRLLVPRSAIA